jgi:hypothetical protein
MRFIYGIAVVCSSGKYGNAVGNVVGWLVKSGSSVEGSQSE